MSPPRYLQLQRSFVVAMAVIGAILFMISSSLLQTSSYDLFYRRHSVRRLKYGTFSEETLRHVADLLSQSTMAPVTDPPWLKQKVKYVRPFVPSDSHPFLSDNLISSPDICRNVSVDLLIVIHSSVKNFQRRRLLRETWAAVDTINGMTVKRVFALGMDKSDPLIQILVNTEQANFGDVVQGDFDDAFQNLTRKAVNALRWINDNCLHARFVLKADDDVFVNVFNLVENHLQQLANRRYTVMCRAKAENSSVIIRDPNSKWYLPETFLPELTHWPAFCSGFVVILTTDNIPELYKASFATAYMPIDDAYVYGLLPLAAQNYTLHYLDISTDLVVDDGRLLTHYQKSQPMQLAGTALSESTVTNLWQLTVANLSPWGKLRADLTQLYVNVSAQFL